MRKLSFSFKLCRHLWRKSYPKMLSPPLFHQETLSQLIKPSQIKHYNRTISKPALIHLLASSFPSLMFSYGCVSSLTVGGGPQHPCVPALWMPPGKWVPCLSFPSRAFCTFNHVTLSQADYRRLSSLEKVRAGIRTSWGIRSPNWFQLSLPSNDQFSRCIDGAVSPYVGKKGLFFHLFFFSFWRSACWTAPAWFDALL